MRSGRSMVLAMVRTTSRASLCVGQSKRLYIISCFWVHRRSSCQGNGKRWRVNHRDCARAEWCHHCFSCKHFSGHISRAARSQWARSSCHHTTGSDEGRGQTFCPAQYLLLKHLGQQSMASFPVLLWAPPYLIHKQHGGFLRGPLGAKSLCQQFGCMVSCCLLACHLLHWEKTGMVNSKDLLPWT